MTAADLALAVANSVRALDELGSPAMLRGWLDANRPNGTPPSDGVLLRLHDFRSLRDAVVVAVRRAVERSPPPDDAVEAFNAASGLVPTWPVLRVGGSARVTTDVETTDASETNRILASIARSAIELLGGPDAARLRECPACRRFFLAARPRQCWCSDTCGNRARVARHRARRAAGIAR